MIYTRSRHACSLMLKNGVIAMQWSGWIHFCFTVLLFVAFIALVIYYYNPKRKEKIEKPKYKLFDDEEESRKQ